MSKWKTIDLYLYSPRKISDPFKWEKKLLPCNPVSCVKEAACSKSKGSQRKMACRRSKQFTWLIDSCLHHMTDLKATSELSVQYVKLTRDIGAAALMSFPIKKLVNLALCVVDCSANDSLSLWCWLTWSLSITRCPFCEWGKGCRHLPPSLQESLWHNFPLSGRNCLTMAWRGTLFTAPETCWMARPGNGDKWGYSQWLASHKWGSPGLSNRASPVQYLYL